MKKILNDDKNSTVMLYGKQKFAKINVQKGGKLVIKG
jgi:hypothetical protein